MNEILTPCILQTIIICCTIIIVSLIAVSAYRVKKNNIRTWGSYIFSASVLIILAIAIFSISFYGDRNVLDFVSLASALVSIILAVITIIYSFVINGQTSGQIDKLATTSECLQDAANQTKQSITEMKSAAQQVINASNSYDTSAKSLDKNIQEILRCIKGISYKVGADADYETIGGLKSVEEDDVDKFKDEVFSNFNEGNPNAGAVLLYLCSKINETGQPCDLKELFAEDITMYYLGYIVALNAIGFTAIELDFAAQTIKTVDVVEELIEGAKQRMKIESKNKFIKVNKQKIDDYFSMKTGNNESSVNPE